MLDVVLGSPLNELFQSLPLDEVIFAGILHRQGDVGRLLGVVCAFEDKQDIDLPIHYRGIYLDAVREVNLIDKL